MSFMFKVRLNLLPEYETIILRQTFNTIDDCYANLKRSLCERYNFLANTTLMIIWVDTDSDKIIIKNNEDLKLFMELKGNILWIGYGNDYRSFYAWIDKMCVKQSHTRSLISYYNIQAMHDYAKFCKTEGNNKNVRVEIYQRSPVSSPIPRIPEKKGDKIAKKYDFADKNASKTYFDFKKKVSFDLKKYDIDAERSMKKSYSPQSIAQNSKNQPSVGYFANMIEARNISKDSIDRKDETALNETINLPLPVKLLQRPKSLEIDSSSESDSSVDTQVIATNTSRNDNSQSDTSIEVLLQPTTSQESLTDWSIINCNPNDIPDDVPDDIPKTVEMATDDTQSVTNSKINLAVASMIDMGFSNSGGWLNRLLESVNGDVDAAVKELNSGFPKG